MPKKSKKSKNKKLAKKKPPVVTPSGSAVKFYSSDAYSTMGIESGKSIAKSMKAIADGIEVVPPEAHGLLHVHEGRASGWLVEPGQAFQVARAFP